MEVISTAPSMSTAFWKRASRKQPLQKSFPRLQPPSLHGRLHHAFTVASAEEAFHGSDLHESPSLHGRLHHAFTAASTAETFHGSVLYPYTEADMTLSRQTMSITEAPLHAHREADLRLQRWRPLQHRPHWKSCSRQQPP
jgi:hypothetical protein